MKGMTVSVLRNASGYDCTNSGISFKHDRLTLIGPGVPELWEPTDDAPAILLLVRPKFGDMIAVPLDANTNGRHNGYMFGGNFLWDCDCRLPFDRPIKIHDRKE